MSISESLYFYQTGRLICLKTEKLNLGLTHLINKIDYTESVIKEAGDSLNLSADLRMYNDCKDAIVKLLEARKEVYVLQ